MENVEVDTALLLENALRERVQLIVRQEMERAVVGLIGKIMHAEKDKMLMEVAIKIGQMLKGYEEEGRKPLWESKPEDFGLTRQDFKPHGLQPNHTTGEVKEIDNAIREQT